MYIIVQLAIIFSTCSDLRAEKADAGNLNLQNPTSIREPNTVALSTVRLAPG